MLLWIGPALMKLVLPMPVFVQTSRLEDPPLHLVVDVQMDTFSAMME
jgi:hypothetical protein